MKKITLITLSLGLSLGLVLSTGCTKKEPAPASDAGNTGAQVGAITTPAKTDTGGELKISEIKVGTGAEAAAGKTISVHYTGWLLENGKEGKEFDSSVKRGQPFSFKLGAGQVIPGWDQGVVGMKVKGKRKLTIPPQLAYGERGAGSVIPPQSTLIFDVELLDVK